MASVNASQQTVQSWNTGYRNKVLNENVVPKQIVSVSQSLEKWIETYFKEARRAVRGIGKYRFSPEFSSFYVDPAIWGTVVRRNEKSTFQSFSSKCPSTNDLRKAKSSWKKARKFRKSEKKNKATRTWVIRRENYWGRTKWAGHTSKNKKNW